VHVQRVPLIVRHLETAVGRETPADLTQELRIVAGERQPSRPCALAIRACGPYAGELRPQAISSGLGCESSHKVRRYEVSMLGVGDEPCNRRGHAVYPGAVGQEGGV